MKLIKKQEILPSALLIGVIAISIVILSQSKLLSQPESPSNIQKSSKLYAFAVASQTDTSKWKTYNNKRWGYSFKYPEDWFVEETTELITTIRAWKRGPKEYSDPLRDIDIVVYPTKEDWPSFEKEISLGRMKKKEKVKIGGQKGEALQEITERGYAYEHILIQKPKRLYRITIYSQHPQMEIFNQILETFAFNP